MTDKTHDDSRLEATSSTGARTRDVPTAVWALVAARAVNRVGAFTLPFLAVVLGREFGLSTATAGSLLALFGVATIPSRLAGGVLADRLGRVPTIGLGLVGCAAAQLLIAASATLAGAVVGVVLLGLAFELYEPPSQALVADLTDDASRPIAFGLLSAALAGGGAAAGLLAAWLAGIGLRWLLVADAASCLVCAVVVVTVLRPHLRDGTTARTSGEMVAPATETPDARAVLDAAAVAAGGATSPWRDRRLLAMLAAGTLFALLSMTLVTTLPLTVVARGLPVGDAGLLLTVSAVTVIVGQPLLRWTPLSGTLLSTAFRALAVGYAVLAAGLLATGLATSLVGFTAATVLWSVGELLLMGHAWSIVSGLAPEGARGRYLAAYGLSWGGATVLAPLLGTRLLAAGGPLLLWSLMALLALGLAAVQPLLSRVCTRVHSGSLERR